MVHVGLGLESNTTGCSQTPSWEERFALTDSLLARRWAAQSADPELLWAWLRIRVGYGLVRIDALADEVGWSRKRLWSRFQAQFGLPPKRVATLVRFDHAVHRLAAGVDPAHVAAETGYADQSHLHREVVAFAGMTPKLAADASWLAADERAWTPRRRRGGAGSLTPSQPTQIRRG